jgi:UDP-glucose 4-epimerase
VLNNFENKVVAITGGSGYLASAIIQKLTGKTKRLLRVSRKILSSQNGVEDFQLDLLKLESWIRICDSADIIIHLGGNTSLYEAEKNPKDHLISSQLPIKHMIDASQILSCFPRVIFASTATVYGLTKKIIVDESTNTNPITIYDNHKLLSEQQLKLATKDKIISGVSLRLSNVYGPSLALRGSYDRGIINEIAKMSINGNDLKIYGSGKYLRDYIYIDDVVEAFLAASLTNSCESVFNVVNGKSHLLGDVFFMISSKVASLNGRKVAVSNVDWPEDAHEIEKRDFIASNDLLKSKTKWSPHVSLEQGIEFLIDSII